MIGNGRGREQMLDRADHYEMAFGDVPNLTLLAMAEKFAEVPRDLRALFYAILAAPGDKAAYCGLKDRLDAEVSLPDTVALPGGGGRIPVESKLKWERWDCGRMGLPVDIVLPLWRYVHGRHTSQVVYVDERMSIADIARMDWLELTSVSGIKRSRGLEVMYWLGGMGLHLKNAAVNKRPLPDDEEDEDEDDWERN